MPTIGIEIDETKIRAANVSADGQCETALETARAPRTADLIDTVFHLVESLDRGADMNAIGIAVSTKLNSIQRSSDHSPGRSRWPGVVKELARRTGNRVYLEHSINARAWAEHRFGSGQTQKNVVFISVGASLECAILSEGELLRGARGAASNLKHLPLRPGGRACECGAYGCLGQYASFRALEFEAAIVATNAAIGKSLASARVGGEIHAAHVAELLRQGDQGAAQALRRISEPLGEACAVLQSVLDPECFVLDCDQSGLIGSLISGVARAYAATTTTICRGVETLFRPAALGHEAAIIGVADQARASRSHGSHRTSGTQFETGVDQ